MIGNDIVDLKHTAVGRNWECPRFLEKVFTEKEEALIFSSENRHQTVWLLWSMKEAAYKIYVQEFKKCFFNPKRLACELIHENKGIVKIDDIEYFTESTLTEDYVYTIAKQNTIQEVYTSVYKTKKEGYKIQSDKLKQRFLKSISKRKGLTFQALKVEKTAIGIPHIFYASKQLSIPFSLTHCGRFSGFAY
ncbi:4'-phosphopantetheinyl transferase superfamily protein [Formosa sp. PL04]|uniref:4'-phosphopantetheinyl transferase family protein n=1 Tax=Formosa sp. PL04 TaxID=3081755 RepID=UPI0029811767|nr:4'-phosphopantetheinyl transferase superfamily protein [Formosa sp. PL04]MDW5289527.1 4'-phosphopantetheinyl transferase superfamily protein [Formosa sp. PL04]